MYEHLLGDKRNRFPKEAELLEVGTREIDGPPLPGDEDLEGGAAGPVDLSTGYRCVRVCLVAEVLACSTLTGYFHDDTAS